APVSAARRAASPRSSGNRYLPPQPVQRKQAAPSCPAWFTVNTGPVSRSQMSPNGMARKRTATPSSAARALSSLSPGRTSMWTSSSGASARAISATPRRAPSSSPGHSAGWLGQASQQAAWRRHSAGCLQSAVTAELYHPGGSMLDTLLYYVAAGAGAAFQVISACHALLNKRDPRSQLGWVVVCIMLPIVGALGYWFFGVNRIRTRARRWQQRGRFRGIVEERAQQQAIRSLAVEHPEHAEEVVQLLQISQRVTRRPLLGGNLVEPLYNGERAYPAMLEAIEQAQKYIHLSTYIFNVDKVGEQFVEALGQASERGVEVRILVDAIGEKYGRPRLSKAMKRFPRARVTLFLPLTLSWKSIRVNLRNHRKMLVVDGAVAFTGGMNIAHRHVVSDADNEHPTADIQFRIRGPAVTAVNETFLDDWFFATGEAIDWTPETVPVAGRALCRCIKDGP